MQYKYVNLKNTEVIYNGISIPPYGAIVTSEEQPELEPYADGVLLDKYVDLVLKNNQISLLDQDSKPSVQLLTNLSGEILELTNTPPVRVLNIDPSDVFTGIYISNETGSTKAIDAISIGAEWFCEATGEKYVCTGFLNDIFPVITVATAPTNQNSTPALGTIQYFLSDPGLGWVECNGALYRKSGYPNYINKFPSDGAVVIEELPADDITKIVFDPNTLYFIRSTTTGIEGCNDGQTWHPVLLDSGSSSSLASTNITLIKDPVNGGAIVIRDLIPADINSPIPTYFWDGNNLTTFTSIPALGPKVDSSVAISNPKLITWVAGTYVYVAAENCAKIAYSTDGGTTWSLITTVNKPWTHAVVSSDHLSYTLYTAENGKLFYGSGSTPPEPIITDPNVTPDSATITNSVAEFHGYSWFQSKNSDKIFRSPTDNHRHMVSKRLPNDITAGALFKFYGYLIALPLHPVYSLNSYAMRRVACTTDGDRWDYVDMLPYGGYTFARDDNSCVTVGINYCFIHVKNTSGSTYMLKMQFYPHKFRVPGWARISHAIPYVYMGIVVE